MAKVFFVGNRMAGDDGIALAVLDMLKDELAGVQMQESTGTDIADMAEKEIVVVDAFIGKPGEVKEIRLQEIAQNNPVSAHDLGAAQGIMLLKSIQPKTKVRIIGIGIRKMQGYGGISKEIRDKLPQIKKKVAAKIREFS
ncbi:MAG: hydrogenase maturation protease [Candidatus Woesearchaeota archaeon]